MQRSIKQSLDCFGVYMLEGRQQVNKNYNLETFIKKTHKAQKALKGRFWVVCILLYLQCLQHCKNQSEHKGGSCCSKWAVKKGFWRASMWSKTWIIQKNKCDRCFWIAGWNPISNPLLMKYFQGEWPYATLQARENKWKSFEWGFWKNFFPQ